MDFKVKDEYYRKNRLERVYSVRKVKGLSNLGDFKSKVKAFKCAKESKCKCIIFFRTFYPKGTIMSGTQCYHPSGDMRFKGIDREYYLDENGWVTWVRDHNLYNSLADFEIWSHMMKYTYGINIEPPFSTDGMYKYSRKDTEFYWAERLYKSYESFDWGI